MQDLEKRIEQAQFAKIRFAERFLNNMRGRASPVSQAEIAEFLVNLEEHDAEICRRINDVLAVARHYDREDQEY